MQYHLWQIMYKGLAVIDNKNYSVVGQFKASDQGTTHSVFYKIII